MNDDATPRATIADLPGGPFGDPAVVSHILDRGLIGVLLVGLDSEVLFANTAFRRMLGHDEADGQRLTAADIVHPDEIAAVRAQIARIKRGESGQYQAERRYVHRDGHTVWCAVVLTAVREPRTGQPASFIVQAIDISALKQTETALAASGSRWQFALENAGQGVWDQDLATRRTYYSPLWKAMLGFRDEEIGDAEREWTERVHPDDIDRVMTDVERVAASGQGEPFDVEYRIRHRDGRWLWVHGRGKVVERAPDGTALRMVGTDTDITRRKAVETELAALNERTRLAVQAGGIGIWEFDIIRDDLVGDRRIKEFYDTPRGTFGGGLAEWLAMIHPDDRDRVGQEWAAAIAATSLFESEFRVPQRGGRIRHIRELARIIRGPDGAPVRAIGVNWDVTDYKNLTEALFEEKERLRITLHSIGDAVICTDGQARITFMNPIAEQMTGWSSVTAVGRPLRDVFRLVDEATEAAIVDPVEECLARMQPFYLDDGAVLASRSGERRNVQDSAAPVRTATGEIIGAVLVFQDVTRARQLQRQLAHSATHDSLTGLPNRAAFERKLQEASDQARREQREHALCFIDLDRFKIVNDSAGHAAGDALLREVGNTIRQACRIQDVTARLGGDEFALLLPDCPLPDAERIGAELVRAIGALRFAWDGRIYDIGASVGLTAVTRESPRSTELMSQADAACYAAKAAGRSRVSTYTASEGTARRHHREIRVAAGIRGAIEANRFRLFAQEIRCLRPQPGRRRHFELLLRMEDEAGGIEEPGNFIPAAERFDLMGNLDRWVIRAALREHGTRLRDAGLQVSINLSANTLNDPFLWPFLQEELAASGLEPTRVCFEITETALINNLSAAGLFVGRARGAGCAITLDDFGTGLSSFTYLRQFPVDYLKIDGGFIRQLAANPIDRAIVEAVHAVGRRLGAETVAEYVETDETLATLREIGIDHAQGYAIGRPRPLDEVLPR